MSAEHGGHSGAESQSVEGIISTLILCMIAIRIYTEMPEDIVQWAVQGEGGHGGHH